MPKHTIRITPHGISSYDMDATGFPDFLVGGTYSKMEELIPNGAHFAKATGDLVAWYAYTAMTQGLGALLVTFKRHGLAKRAA